MLTCAASPDACVVLAEQRLECEARLKELQATSNFPTNHKPYQLRGVAIQPTPMTSHTFLTRPSDAAKPEQWWRTSFEADVASTARVSSQTLRQEDVLAAAGQLKHETLLVYAREDMLRAEDFAIDEKLKVRLSCLHVDRNERCAA